MDGWGQQTGGGGRRKKKRVGQLGGRTTLARKRSSYAPCDWSDGPCSVTPDSIAAKIAHAAQAVRGRGVPCCWLGWASEMGGSSGGARGAAAADEGEKHTLERRLAVV
ncbi:hypothetical protein BDDG_13499 [Blastomyces dermatitidis ATCC 18188]|uniref:Uncharacterized protein n=1 Tax=Ajellomyces dermatitidis (strain ATCC 18188 / CBS 674.68) TaxID=653446 RepID=A0A0J9HJH2_AJEDA|nr:hypothetical protein BDDG_13499 [Blastomyces dermatitidis ATCC 18188]